VNKTAIEHRRPTALKEKGQYAMAFGIISVMLYAVGFPIFLLVFVGVLSFFVWKVFSAEGRAETRRIFEFYLTANEILRDDDRRWYGFEIQDAIDRGEAIVTLMAYAPPLVHYGLGALYQKLDDHEAAAKHLASVVESPTSEISVAHPNYELREYVRLLRKIERSPAESPQTAAAVRSLERARRNRAAAMLPESRQHLTETPQTLPAATEERPHSVVDMLKYREHDANTTLENTDRPQPASVVSSRKRKAAQNSKTANRQTISEVLHDIYDKNA